MIEFSIGTTKLRLDFSFFAVIAVFLLLDKGGAGTLGIIACCAHELAHIITMRFFRIRVDSLTLYGAGMKLSAKELDFAPVHARFAVLGAGAAMNLALAAVLAGIGCPLASAVNLLTALFNLLPFAQLDGAEMLKLAVLTFGKPEQVDRAARVGNVLSLLIISAAIVLFGRHISITLASTVVYMLVILLLRV